MPKDDAYLHDIIESARMIQGYLSGVDRDEFLRNFEKQDAIYRRFEIIGEAARHLSPEALKALPEIPWRLVVGMRNILIHDYGEVDAERVWKTAHDDLPAMTRLLERHFAERAMQGETSSTHPPTKA